MTQTRTAKLPDQFTFRTTMIYDREWSAPQIIISAIHQYLTTITTELFVFQTTGRVIDAACICSNSVQITHILAGLEPHTYYTQCRCSIKYARLCLTNRFNLKSPSLQITNSCEYMIRMKCVHFIVHILLAYNIHVIRVWG